ncbi:ROK family protein [Ponticaulis sp.]|uniref:ROK family protein n=1 Tax=Ponticaulis sp. TaxID=2020902 RepID=UPI00262217F2|nr:ROK family protein [Ponticaulis sp.]MDF1681202.1 ROK family protein [Ponticaulis sp.]
MLGGIEAGGTKCVVAVADDDLSIIAQATIPTTAPVETFASILSFFEQAQNDHGSGLTAIGVASFGPVGVDPASSSYGEILETPKLAWRGVSYQDRLSHFGVPVVVDTDVNGAALAEQIFAATEVSDTLAYVTVGTGIGVGVVQAGKLLSGFSHFEMGHILPRRAEGDTFEGLCPSHDDCLEGLASGPAIKARWGQSLSDLSADHPAHDIEADYLAQLVHSITLMHAPHKIVLGGGVMKAEGLIERIRAKAERYLAGYMKHAALDTGLQNYITKPKLGDKSGIIGALALARASDAGE